MGFRKHKCSFGTECIEMAIKIAKERDTGHKSTEEEVHEDIRTSVREVARMLTQARLGLNLQRRQKQRLLWGNQSKRIRIASEDEELVSGYSWTTEDVTKHEVSNTKTMLWEKEANVITLAGLKIFPKMYRELYFVLETRRCHLSCTSVFMTASRWGQKRDGIYNSVWRRLVWDRRDLIMIHIRFKELYPQCWRKMERRTFSQLFSI